MGYSRVRRVRFASIHEGNESHQWTSLRYHWYKFLRDVRYQGFSERSKRSRSTVHQPSKKTPLDSITEIFRTWYWAAWADQSEHLTIARSNKNLRRTCEKSNARVLKWFLWLYIWCYCNRELSGLTDPSSVLSCYIVPFLHFTEISNENLRRTWGHWWWVG